MWLITMPGLLFGTIGVLAPLRLDELGAAPRRSGRCSCARSALEAIVEPDRRPR